MKTKKGFTLIELLIVVLIIGILAAIAVPKYQIAVLKSEYSTLKAKTRAIAESVNRYKLATNNYPKEFSELDISLPDIKSTPRAQEGDTGFFIYFNDGASCTVWIKNYDKAKCILPSNKIHFYVDLNTLKPYLCYTQKDYETGHKVCQQETGKTREQATVNCGNNDSYCGYEY